ncbi:hypothetical protein D9601_10285 [Sphingomonas sp. MA1305]|uniref:hypothetical protein n=1 Tax=Sphingomonas sp. MA1305 TaxID=2479204 RepID=UPI0018DF15BA|nr:hypothetical protein [Sphingomonas sp. MA1305]MBI0475739.1 hypothetical protein [Sphingomonas sp. MA1305]
MGASNTEQGPRAPAFDAAAWFAAWSDHGGIAMLLGDRLWIGRAPVLDRDAARSLNGLRGPIMHPDAQNALAGLLRANAALSEQMMEG